MKKSTFTGQAAELAGGNIGTVFCFIITFSTVNIIVYISQKQIPVNIKATVGCKSVKNFGLLIITALILAIVELKIRPKLFLPVTCPPALPCGACQIGPLRIAQLIQGA